MQTECRVSDPKRTECVHLGRTISMAAIVIGEGKHRLAAIVVADVGSKELEQE